MEENEAEGNFPMIFMSARFKRGWVIFWVQEITQSLFPERTLALQKWNRIELTTPILGMPGSPTKTRSINQLPTTIGKKFYTDK